LITDIILEGVLILRNSSLKLKTVADNTILPAVAVSSEKISKCIKFKTEKFFYLKRSVCKFHTLKIRELREEIEENATLMARINDCLEAMRENPENVTEG
jgi:hypothetical protein